MPRPKAERPAFRRAAARATAILDSVDFPRAGPVRWSEADHAFVVKYDVDGEATPRVKFLGTTPLAAIEGARRERMKALAPERRARAAEGFQRFMDTMTVIVPIAGSIVSRVPLPRP
jgi:hypothetical protein